MGDFDFFQTNQNYAETTLLFDKEYVLNEDSHTAQQSLRRFKSPKTCIGEKNFA